MDVEFRKEQLSEVAIITSAGPARSLGLSQKGHLGVGADADVTIYPETPDHGFLFSYPRYVIKGGEIVVEEGDVREVPDGREYIVRPAHDDQIEEYLRPLFEKVYTMSFANYPVEMERLRHPEIQTLK
jgi:formylmethanofuran dehydrogenase subunit A